MKPSEEQVWFKYYPEGIRDIPLDKCTFYQSLEKTAIKYSANKAISYFGNIFTYNDLLNKINLYAKGLTASGVKKGDIISLITVNVPESIFFLYAANKLGVVVNIVDPRMDAGRIEEVLVNTKTRFAIALEPFLEKVDTIAAKLNLEKLVVINPSKSFNALYKLGYKLKYKKVVAKFKNAVSCEDFEKASQSAPEVTTCDYEYDRDAFIVYTGGTTGMPKGVLLNDDSPNSVLYAFRYGGCDYKVGDRFLTSVPMFACYGFVAAIHVPLCLGMEIDITPEYDVNQIANRFAKFKPNHMLAVPTFFEAIINSEKVQKMDIRFLKNFGTGGDTVNPVLEKKISDFMKSKGVKYPMGQGYGMTEAASAACWGYMNYFRSQSSGIPAPLCNFGIFDPETEEELDYNQLGEICMSGSHVMKGYYGLPDESAHALHVHKDGKTWLHSGDLGYMDEDGYIYIKNRIKHMIIRPNGMKDFPIQYETVAQKDSDVRMVGVVPVRDRRYDQGNLPLVFVETDAKDKEAVHDRVMKLLLENIPEDHWPAGVVVLDQLPLTPVGKVDIAKLTKDYEFYDYENKYIS